MIGSERVRFCGQCELNVYNLSAMSRPEAESLITRTEGRLCIRFYRRREGSIITRDCPLGLRALKRRASRIKRAVASSILGFLAGIGVNAAAGRFENSGTHGATMGVMAEPLVKRPSDEPMTLKEDHVLGRLIRIPAKPRTARQDRRD
jgi:hypothetical protein